MIEVLGAEASGHGCRRSRLRGPFRDRFAAEVGGKLLDAGMGEEGVDGNLLSELLGERHDEAQSKERVAAHLEEVVRNTDLSPFEVRLEDGEDLRLDGVARRDLLALLECSERGQWETLAVDLAVRREGEFLKRLEVGRQVTLREDGGELLADRGGLEGRALGEVIADETFAGGQVFALHDDGLADAGDGGHLGLDVAELHADAAQFHLEVDATEALETVVTSPAAEVAGAVEAALPDEG